MSAINTVFRFGDFECSLDLSDYDLLDRWEDAHKRCAKVSQEASGIEKTGQRMKALVEAIAEVFDAVFGEGGASAVLGASTDIPTAFAAYDALLDCGNPQINEITEHVLRFSGKYAPANREQCRENQARK